MNNNRKAFLSMLALSEGTSTSPITKCDGFDVIVTGIDGIPEVFYTYNDHPFNRGRPAKVINSHGLTSTASGRYQFLLRDWHHYRDLLDLPDPKLFPDGAFSAAAQDAWAIQLIRERSALPLIDLGEFTAAVARVSNLWASLTGSPYGQHTNSIDVLQAAYTDAGGELA